MRDLKRLVWAVLIVTAVSGCGIRDREWGSCAIAGAVIGAAVGGITGGTLVNNIEDTPTNGERGGAIAGGIVGGGALGALLGHAICDPIREPPPPPPPPPPPAPAPPRKIELRAPLFDFNKATLRPLGHEKVREAAQAMKEHPKYRASIEGHTDSIGSAEYNLRLSERRAQSVADALVANGIEASRLTVKGFGKANPIASNDTEEGRQENRRVDIYLKE